MNLKNGISNLVIPLKYLEVEPAQEKKEMRAYGKVSLNTDDMNKVT